MKNVFKYLSAALLLLTVGTACHDNDNWVILDEVQPGNYVTGDATIYSAAATSSSFTTADLDGSADVTDVLNIYTWLKAGEPFYVLKVDDAGENVNYGKGSEVASSKYDTYDLAAGGSAFTVSKAGLYNLILNNADNQLTIVEADFGIIGDATPGAWNDETKFTSTVYDEKYATVEMSMTGVTLNNKEIKFRYANTWGLEIPYQGSIVKVHANMGGASASTLTTAFSTCQGGGDNFNLSTAGIYEVTLKYELRSNKFSAKAVCTDEDTSSATLPENMYITGTPYDWDDWNQCEQLVNTHNDGNFWKMIWFNAGDQVKFSSTMAWDGNDFGASTDAPLGFGTYETGKENITIKNTGYHLVWVKCSLSEDKKSVIKEFSLLEPVVYLVGDCAPGGWADMFSDAAKFTVSDKEFVSPVFVADAEIRMCVLLEGNQWWQTEFMIFDGLIEYRAAGGDQARINGTAGQKATLNFTTGTGSIN